MDLETLQTINSIAILILALSTILMGFTFKRQIHDLSERMHSLERWSIKQERKN